MRRLTLGTIEAASFEQAVEEVEAAAKEKRDPKSSAGSMRLVGEVVRIVNSGFLW